MDIAPYNNHHHFTSGLFYVHFTTGKNNWCLWWTCSKPPRWFNVDSVNIGLSNPIAVIHPIICRCVSLTFSPVVLRWPDRRYVCSSRPVLHIAPRGPRPRPGLGQVLCSGATLGFIQISVSCVWWWGGFSIDP